MRPLVASQLLLFCLALYLFLILSLFFYPYCSSTYSPSHSLFQSLSRTVFCVECFSKYQHRRYFGCVKNASIEQRQRAYSPFALRCRERHRQSYIPNISFVFFFPLLLHPLSSISFYIFFIIYLDIFKKSFFFNAHQYRTNSHLNPLLLCDKFFYFHFILYL